MTPEILKLANSFVQKREIDYLADYLNTRAEHWQNRANGCGCLQCRKMARNALMDLFIEKHRLFAFHNDQEEEWIANYAISKLINKDNGGI